VFRQLDMQPAFPSVMSAGSKGLSYYHRWTCANPLRYFQLILM